MTDDPVVTILVSTPAGRLTFTAEPIVFGQTLILRGTHVQGARPNTVGVANMAVIARAVYQGMGFDGLVVKGAVRTTGANPGRRPRDIRHPRSSCCVCRPRSPL